MATDGVVRVVSSSTRGPGGQDSAALAEIELYGELMIAASASADDRLPPDQIDEVLNSAAEPLPETPRTERPSP